MISLVASWIGLIVSFLFAIPFANFIFGNTLFSSLAASNLFFVVAIPILSLLLLVSRLLFKKRISPTWRNGLTLFWVVNVIGMFAFASRVGWEFNQEEMVVQAEKTLSFSQDTISINVTPESNRNSIINFDGMKIYDENLISNHIHIKLKRSADENFRLIQTSRSRGKNSKEGTELANAIQYEPTIGENGIIFPTEFTIQKGSKWRAQEMTLTLEIPQGKSLVFPKETYRLNRYLYVDHDLEHPSVRFSGEQVWTLKEDGFYSKENAPQSIGGDLGFKDFTDINVRGALKVNINKGKKFDVNVQGKGRYLKNVEMKQVGETLDIQLGNGKHDHYNSPVRLFITAPDLSRIDLEQTDDVNISGFDGKKLDIINEGHHEVKAFVDVDSLYLNFKKNKSDIRGKGKFLKVKLEKGAKLDAEHYLANNAFVKAKSAGRIKLEVVDTLRYHLTHGSRIDSDDQPKILIDDRKVKESSIDKQQ